MSRARELLGCMFDGIDEDLDIDALFQKRKKADGKSTSVSSKDSKDKSGSAAISSSQRRNVPAAKGGRSKDPSTVKARQQQRPKKTANNAEVDEKENDEVGKEMELKSGPKHRQAPKSASSRRDASPISKVASTRQKRPGKVVNYKEDQDDEDLLGGETTGSLDDGKKKLKKEKKMPGDDISTPKMDPFEECHIRALPNYSKMSEAARAQLSTIKSPEEGATDAEKKKFKKLQAKHTEERKRNDAYIQSLMSQKSEKPGDSQKKVATGTPKRPQLPAPAPKKSIFSGASQAAPSPQVAQAGKAAHAAQATQAGQAAPAYRATPSAHQRFLSMENSSNRKTPPPTPDVALITMKGNAGKGYTSSFINSPNPGVQKKAPGTSISVNASSSGYRRSHVQSARKDGSVPSNNCRQNVKASSITSSSSSDSPTSPVQVHPNQHTQGVRRCYKKYMVPIIEGNEPLNVQLFGSLATKVDNMFNAGYWTRAEDEAIEPTVQFNGNRNYGGCEETISCWFPEFKKPYEDHQKLLKKMEQQAALRKRQFAGQGSSSADVTSASSSKAQPRKSARAIKAANYEESEDEDEHAPNHKRSKRSTEESDDESYNEKLQ